MNELEKKLRKYIKILELENDARSKIMQTKLFNYPEHELILRTQYNMNLEIKKHLEQLL